MIDFSAFPAPENAPEPGTCVRIERPEEGLAVLVLDPPHRSLAVLDAPLLRDLEAAVTALEEDTGLRGVVITGRTPFEFAAGADVKAIEAIEDPATVESVIRAVHELLLRIEKLKARTVAAVGGAVPGGAYELSLACDRIVSTDHHKTRIGLPETQLGIIPAWGGTHRLPQRVGLPLALDSILTGKLHPAKKAKRLGLIDRLTKPEYLVRVASDIALGRSKCPRRKRGHKAWTVDRNPLAKWVIGSQARKMVLAKTKGHYPAPLEALELLLEAPGTSMAAAAHKEASAGARLSVSPVCKSLISIFFASEEAKKLGRPESFTPRSFEHAAVIGAGVMGGGIASLFANRGLSVRLVDLSQAALDEALIEHERGVTKRRQRRRLEPHAADAALDALDTSTQLVGLGRCEVVVEAIAEVLPVKKKVLGDIAAMTSADTILATNTSSLSVDAIAAELPNPERVCGMHFFNPVRLMPLVEVVRGSATSDQTVAEIAALCLRLGKTPVVVKDVAGFLVNRVLGPYLDEAVRLFVEGASPERVDRLLTQFGMPMGPFQLLDEVGFDIAAHAAQSLHEAYGERMLPSSGLESLISPERLGKKTGRGFYRHAAAGAKKRGEPELTGDLASFQTGDRASALSDEDIKDRLVLAMVNEGVRCLEEDVVIGPTELDLATVFGMGFAPFRGGLLRFADSLGATEVVKRLERIASAPDVSGRSGGTAKFTPAARLKELAASGGTFHGGAVRPSASETDQEPVLSS